MTVLAVGRVRVERVRVEAEAGDREALGLRSRPRISVACDADRLATSMWLVPGVAAGRARWCAASRRSRGPRSPSPAAQSATSISGVSGNGAVRKPSFIAAAPPWWRAAIEAGCGDLRPSAPVAGALERPRPRRASPRGRRRRWRSAGAPDGRARERRRRRWPVNTAPNVSAKPSTWPPGSRAAAAPARVHQRRVPEQELVGPVAMADPELRPAAPSPRPRRRRSRRSGMRGCSCGPALSWRWRRCRGRRPRSAGGWSPRPRCAISTGDRLRGALGREGHDRRRRACWRTGMNVVRSAMTASTRRPVEEAREVQPVRADVADGPQRAALVRLEAPVPVRVVAAASPGSSGR